MATPGRRSKMSKRQDPRTPSSNTKPREANSPKKRAPRRSRSKREDPSEDNGSRLERLQKIIAASGLTSRRKAEELITQGRVQVNGKTLTELGTKADPFKDRITVDGKPLQGPKALRYLLLYKPPRYLTSLSDERGRPLVTDLLKKVRERVYPVGRLDYMSEGLILLTNDGAFAQAVSHPSKRVPRHYRVKVRGIPPMEQLERIRNGKIRLDGKPVRPERFELAGGQRNPWFRITLTEGRNREIRRLFEAVGHPVVRLKRVGIGPIRVGRLKSGHWRELTPDEIRQLLRYSYKSESRKRSPER